MWLQVRELIIPEKFVGVNRLYDLDIGLIVLEKRVPVNSFIMPACVDWRGSMTPKHSESGVVSRGTDASTLSLIAPYSLDKHRVRNRKE